MAVIRNNHVLTVPDADATAEYFIDKLGFRCLEIEDPRRRFVERDNFVITLRTNPNAVSPKDLGDHAQFAYWVVDDAWVYYDHILGRGAELPFEPIERTWGMREFEIVTPDGHRIRVGEPI